MSNDHKKPRPQLVDTKGNALSEEPIGLNVLVDRCIASGMPDMWSMARELNIDIEEFQQVIANLAKAQRFQPTKTQIENIVGTVGWGIALGFAFAKKAKPIELLH